jgi:tripartite-type tricarboxylate transporter receptor subunit TctC
MRLVIASVAMLVATSSPAQTMRAGEVPDFYEGRELRMLIGYSAGGGYDTYARLLARHLGRHIPGNPRVVPQNMPGAASLTLANYLYNVAAKDGSVIGTVARGLAMEPLLSARGTRFVASEFSWLGSLNNEVSVCASWHTSDVKTMQDLMTRELIVGGTGSAAGTDVFPLVVKNLLGANIRLITGYPGGNDILLAMERGEVDGRCGWSWSTVQATRPDWIAEGRLNMLVQFALEKHPDLPDVPLVTEFAASDDERMALELIFARQVMGRPFLAPPGVPPERLDALRRGFDATAADPAFRAEAERMQLELNPVSGEEIDALIARVYGASENAIRLATDAIGNAARADNGAGE